MPEDPLRTGRICDRESPGLSSWTAPHTGDSTPGAGTGSLAPSRPGPSPARGVR
ncbi:hypothetical protein ACFQ2B_06190 [Streptomyces stramineus]